VFVTQKTFVTSNYLLNVTAREILTQTHTLSLFFLETDRCRPCRVGLYPRIVVVDIVVVIVVVTAVVQVGIQAW
jgi:hypothetical protein